MEHDPKAIYRATVRIEVPVLFTASTVPEGTTWDTLRLIAANEIERRLPLALRKVAEIVDLTGPGSLGYYPNGTEYDPMNSLSSERRPITGLRITLPTLGA